MHDDAEFLCIRLAMARQIEMVRSPRANPVVSGAEKRFLFIANPTGDLPGTATEVEQIIASLGGAVEVKRLVGPSATPKAVLTELLSGGYGVIHYAGHAFSDQRNPKNSGLVLAGERVLTADEMERVLRGHPVVFLNACESGVGKSGEYTGGFMGSYTDGLATALLLGGATACVGPLWCIEDESAARFAIEFYSRALKHQHLSEALRQARVAVRTAMPDTDVWATFVLYGDVHSKLLGKGG
jgi:CHAT domain-containing protein